MAKANVPLLSFNRGEVSPLALTRLDLERIQLSAETMLNWLPKTLGPMSIRPGLRHRGEIKSSLACNMVPFVASTDDVALLEFTNGVMRVWVDETPVVFPSVATSITSGTFSAFTGWTDASSGGGASAGVSGGMLVLTPGSAGGTARATITVNVAGADQDVRHSMKIIVPTNAGAGPNGVPRLRVGSTSGADDLVEETRLLPGEHHLSFVPPGGTNIYIDVFYANRHCNVAHIDSMQIEAAGTLEVVTPWATADLGYMSFAQSADVVFVACRGVKPYRIERRGVYSWSVVEHPFNDGPFLGQTAADVQLKGSVTGIGTGTLTANRGFFRAEHEGALFRLFHDGQRFSMQLGGGNQHSDAIRVAGVQSTNYNDRVFSFTITGTWVGTLKTERSLIGPDTGFYEYPRDASAAATINITANAAYSNEDLDDNVIAWYRMGFADGDWTSGSAVIAADYKGGGDYGIVKVGPYINTTTIGYTIVRPLRGTTYTVNWSEGSWSEYQGYPACVALYEGRLWWFGGAQIFGSVSDNYESFDQGTVGDSGPIIRTLGDGPVDQLNFALPLGRLIIGTSGGEFVVKSSSIDEPLTPANFSIKPISTYGSQGPFPAIRIDDRGLFVHHSEQRLLEISPANTPTGYNTTDLTLLHPTLLSAGVVSIGVQDQPDVRVHCVLADGTVAILTYNSAEDVTCWSRFETDGDVERVVVLPGVEQDQVFYVVKRVIGGSDKRYLEEWAKDIDTDGGLLNCLADSYRIYDGTATTSITGYSHLAGESVVVWSEGACIEESDGAGGMQPKLHTVSAGGVITLAAASASVIAGLPYTAQWKSAKLAYAAEGGTALNMTKRPVNLGLVLYNTHHRGLKFGKDFTSMDVISQRVEGADVASGTIHSLYDHEPVSLPSNFGTDSRLCLQGQSPYPCTVLGLTVGVVVNAKG